VGYDITERGAPASNRSKTQRFVALSLHIETNIQPFLPPDIPWKWAGVQGD